MNEEMNRAADGVAWLCAWRLALAHSHGWAVQVLPRFETLCRYKEDVPSYEELAARATFAAELKILAGGEATVHKWFNAARDAAEGIAPMEPSLRHSTASGRLQWNVRPWMVVPVWDSKFWPGALVDLQVSRPAGCGVSGSAIVALATVYAVPYYGTIDFQNLEVKASSNPDGPGAFLERHRDVLVNALVDLGLTRDESEVAIPPAIAEEVSE